MRYLLDTSICVFLIRQKSAALVLRLQEFDSDELGVSAVTIAELRYGADKSQRPEQNHVALDAFLIPFVPVAFDAQAAHVYGTIRANLERLGTPIGPLDMLIGAHALSLGVGC